MNRSQVVSSQSTRNRQTAQIDAWRQPAVLPLMMRFGLYMLAILGAIQGLLMLAAHEAYAVQFEEGQFVEWLQVVLLVATTSLLIAAVRHARRQNVFLTAMTLLASIALIRELDSVLDTLIPVLGWQLLAGPVFGWAVWLIVRHFRNCCDQALAWAHSPAAGIVWSGMITVLIYAQLTGQADIWQAVMGDGYTRHFKRVIEESAEIFGYLLILFGALETWLWVRESRAQQQARDEE